MTMPLDRLTRIAIGVPNVEQTVKYYAEFGLTGHIAPIDSYAFATIDGGEQLSIVHLERRRLPELGVGADDPDDLDRIAASLAALAVPVERTAINICAVDQAPR
jgi:hypothetical protein